MRTACAISEREIQAALQHYQLSGGKIVHVPDQATPRRPQVGGRWMTVEEFLDGRPVQPQQLELELDVLD